MTDVAASTPPTPKKASKTKKAGVSKPNHPRTSDMVNGAIKSLNERGGSSLQAIKKYISANYKVDAEKLAPFIKRYLKSAVLSGGLVQTKGKGATGSFKISTGEKKPIVTKKKAPKKKPAEKKAATAKPKKAVSPKKPKKAAPKPKKSPAKAKPKKSPAKATKPKTPKKPKTKKAPAKKTAKKASPKKK